LPSRSASAVGGGSGSPPESAALTRTVGLPPAVWVRLHSRQRLQRKLRISVTDHCNFTCFFCHNEGQGPIRRTARAALRTDEIQSVVRVALAEGVTKIKLTGGEPLLFRSGREDAVTLVRKLAQLRQEGEVFDLSMTTNGSLLPGYAERLALAGLDRVTVSMTTTRSTTFGALIASNQRMLHRVLSGLAAAQRAGLTPLKINAVLYHSARHGLGNLGDIRELYQAAVEYGVSELRFFTLLWHDSFERFDDFYHFFSPEMREALASLLRHCRVVAPVEIVEILSAGGEFRPSRLSEDRIRTGNRPAPARVRGDEVRATAGQRRATGRTLRDATEWGWGATRDAHRIPFIRVDSRDSGRPRRP